MLAIMDSIFICGIMVGDNSSDCSTMIFSTNSRTNGNSNCTMLNITMAISMATSHTSSNFGSKTKNEADNGYDRERTKTIIILEPLCQLHDVGRLHALVHGEPFFRDLELSEEQTCGTKTDLRTS